MLCDAMGNEISADILCNYTKYNAVMKSINVASALLYKYQ